MGSGTGCVSVAAVRVRAVRPVRSRARRAHGFLVPPRGASDGATHRQGRALTQTTSQERGGDCRCCGRLRRRLLLLQLRRVPGADTGLLNAEGWWHPPGRATASARRMVPPLGGLGFCEGVGGGGGGRDALEGGEVYFQGAQPTPSHCLPDGKCQPQWHL